MYYITFPILPLCFVRMRRVTWRLLIEITVRHNYEISPDRNVNTPKTADRDADDIMTRHPKPHYAAAKYFLLNKMTFSNSIRTFFLVAIVHPRMN